MPLKIDNLVSLWNWLLVLFFIFATFYFIYSAFAKKRHKLVIGLAPIYIMLSVGGAMYAWIETHSMAWTLGYSTIGFLALLIGLRHLFWNYLHRNKLPR